MKRLYQVGCLLLICMIMVACTAKDINNLFETTEGTPIDTTVAIIANTESTEPSEPSSHIDFDDSVMFEKGYQYGNMQKNVPSGNFMKLGDQVLFEYCSGGQFRCYLYDLVTGEVQSFCKDATCRHSSCAASKLWGNLEVYKGTIYSLTDSGQIVEINESEKEILIRARAVNFIHHNDRLYIRTPDSSLVVLEEGSVQSRVIVEEYTGYWNVIFGQYMYANAADSIIRIDLTAETPEQEEIVPNAGGITDGHYIYYTDNRTEYLYRCDMDGSNAELLLERPVLLASINFDDEYLYYRLYTDHQLDDGPDTYDIYRFPKSDPAKIEKLATLPAPVYQVFTVPGTELIFIKSRVRSNSEDFDIYVMKTDGGKPTKLEIPEY